MTRGILSAVVLLCLTRASLAQSPKTEPRSLRRDQTTTSPTTSATPPAPVSPTVEMWFYEQERSRYDDPKGAVRRNAEARAAQRTSRLASLKWYGMSNSRPMVSTTPIFSTYSPMWTSNTPDPYRWRASAPAVVIRPGVSVY